MRRSPVRGERDQAAEDRPGTLGLRGAWPARARLATHVIFITFVSDSINEFYIDNILVRSRSKRVEARCATPGCAPRPAQGNRPGDAATSPGTPAITPLSKANAEPFNAMNEERIRPSMQQSRINENGQRELTTSGRERQGRQAPAAGHRGTAARGRNSFQARNPP